MAFIIQSDTPSNSTRVLYRDALTNLATRWLLDSKNSYCWSTPDAAPVAAGTMNDLSPNANAMVFNGTGFGDPSGIDGILFDQAANSAVLVGDTSAIDLGGENVNGFYTVLWLAFPTGYTAAAYSGIADHSASSTGAGQWGVDTGAAGTSLRCVVNRDAGSMAAGGAGDDIPVDQVFQLAFGFETSGANNILTKYVNGVAVATATATASPLIGLTGVKVSLGEAGSGTDQGFRLYRALQEVVTVSSGAEPASGNDIAERVAFDYAVNSSRFTF